MHIEQLDIDPRDDADEYGCEKSLRPKEPQWRLTVQIACSQSELGPLKKAINDAMGKTYPTEAAGTQAMHGQTDGTTKLLPVALIRERGENQ